MQFKFIGTEASEVFGFQWYPGTVHDVTDEHAIGKLTHSALFEAVGSPPVQPEPEPVADPEEKEPFEDYVKQPKRRGRPPKTDKPADEVIDGDQNED